MNKKITYPPELRVWSIVLMFLFSVGIFGQNAHNPVLTWDQEVGLLNTTTKANVVIREPMLIYLKTLKKVNVSVFVKIR